MTAVYGIGLWAVARHYDAPITVSATLYSYPLWVATIAALGFFLYFRLLWVAIFHKPGLRALPRAYVRDVRGFLSVERIVQALPLLLILQCFFSLFTSAKNMIPIMQPFSWDPQLSSLDRVLHGGRQPWELLHGALGLSVFSIVLSGLYKIWFVIKFGVAYWQAFSLSSSKLREQFFLTYMASWIVLGTVFATIYSSAGPCFFDRVYPSLQNPYSGLMAFLYEGERVGTVFEVEAMRYLWAAYAERKTSFFSGISAFPSMHVSLATTVTLLGWGTNKWLGVMFFLFLLSTLIGSVFLGWHYAVDGYFSIIVTFILWKGCGRYVAWYSSLTAPRQTEGK